MAHDIGRIMGDWIDTLDQLWRSPNLPVWLMIAVAGFVGLILLATLLRAERSVANGTLAVLTVTAIAVAVIIFMRGNANETAAPSPSAQNAASSLPALACLDDLAGETVLMACEKMLFASPDTTAAAVAHTASQLNRLTSHGDVATANKTMTPDLQALRRAIERDRYGLVAYVLSVRDRCQSNKCAAFASLSDSHQIAANMDERIYEAAIAKYASNWNAPPPVASSGSASLMTPTQPTGRPTNADFPTSASIPPVNIMTPEPPAAPRPAVTATTPPAAPLATSPRPAASAAITPANPAAPKKQPAAPKKQPSPAPVQLTPTPSSTGPAAREQ